MMNKSNINDVELIKTINMCDVNYRVKGEVEARRAQAQSQRAFCAVVHV